MGVRGLEAAVELAPGEARGAGASGLGGGGAEGEGVVRAGPGDPSDRRDLGTAEGGGGGGRAWGTPEGGGGGGDPSGYGGRKPWRHLHRSKWLVVPGGQGRTFPFFPWKEAVVSQASPAPGEA